jgi:FtsP/CotA-like multicopper oxidase with cupredoxin domain
VTTQDQINESNDAGSISRRNLVRLGAASTAALGVGAGRLLAAPSLASRGLLSPDGVFGAASIALADKIYIEAFPTSPLILSPFTDELPVPKAARPVPAAEMDTWAAKPGPGPGQQNSYGNERHQKWSSDVGSPDPIVYKIECLVRAHAFTTSQVLPINSLGQPTISFDANRQQYPAGTVRSLPLSTIYGFNGTFPGPMINAEYGRPALVRFINRLDENPLGLDRQDFGAPDWSFLTHLHNGHTAPESDGNPHYAMRYGPQHQGFRVQDWVDQLYLNWPAANDDSEKQSFFWFHDHRMDHTGSNVYKGMVGLYPIYDPKVYPGTPGRYDAGQETEGLRLPGVRTDNPDGSFDVAYDIPLAFFDARLDDGVTMHKDIHDTQGEFPDAHNPKTHPEWWGKTFYKHFPNHGFTGDIFTVNGTAYPVLHVKRRKYRFRFLDCSISRIYEFKLMASTQGPKPAKDLGYTGTELEGQYRIPDGQQCMQFTQIASDGGLLPFPITRDSFELWPAKRREVIVDFSRYQDGTPTTKGDVIYLTNVMKMPDGRMWTNSSRFTPDPAYKIPMIKIVIGDPAPDDSILPGPTTKLRDLPPLPSDWRTLMNNRMIFEVQRGSAGGEIEWLINGQPFDPTGPQRSLRNPSGQSPLAQQKLGSFNLWEIRNGGGGWVHPFHLHMEEHRTVIRNGKVVTGQAAATKNGHPDDVSREDLVALDPSESTVLYRGFRDFVGPYVAHCHNLAHEDHAMMFGWEITA